MNPETREPQRIRQVSNPCPKCNSRMQKLSAKNPDGQQETTDYYWCSTCKKPYKREWRELV